MATPATAYDVSALGATSAAIFTTPNQCHIRGFSLGAFSGTTRLRIREGGATGKILLTLILLDGQTIGAENLDLVCNGDVYVQFVTGAANLEGSVWIG